MRVMAGLNEIREQPSAGKMEEDCTGENRYPEVSRINIPQQRKKGIPNKKKELTQLRFIRQLDELVESREDAGHSRGVAPLSSVPLPQKTEP